MRRLLAGTFAAAFVVVALLAALGWYVSGRIQREALLVSYDKRPPRYDDATVVSTRY